MNIGGNFPLPAYDEAQYLEPISANNVPISQVSPQPYGSMSPQPYQPYGSIPASPQPYGFGIQLPSISITQPQSPSSIPVGSSTQLHLLRDPSNRNADSVYGSRTFVNERGDLLVDYTPINSVYIKCPRCQQQFVRTQQSSGCCESMPCCVGFMICFIMFVAQIAVGGREPYLAFTGFGICILGAPKLPKLSSSCSRWQCINFDAIVINSKSELLKEIQIKSSKNATNKML